MIELEKIKDIAIAVVKATSKILNDTEVVLVDQTGSFMGFSDSYFERKKSAEWKPYIDTIIKQRKITIIEFPGLNSLCKGCPNEGHCPQTLEIIVPFNIENIYLGYISIITFTKEAKKIYLEKKEQVIEFLQIMIDLMVSAGREHVSKLQSERNVKELETIIQHMDYIVFICDANGYVQRANPAFYDFTCLTCDMTGFKITDLLNSKAIASAITSGDDFEDQESAIVFNNKMHRMVVSCRTIKNEENTSAGYVFFIRTIEDARRFISNTPTLPPGDALSQIVGQSPEILALKKNIHLFSKSISTVLIKGETGTGKELVARCLHSLSSRREKPFVPINCAAIPDNLLESELFGYEEGTFTGASKGGKAGLFELANNGTVFLDEIGDMPLHLQAKILRVLQDKHVIRLGGFHPVELDVRIIAATNQDLESMVQNKKFRSDLFYRLNILPLNVPPLRNRLSDFNELVFHFIGKYNDRLKKNVSGFETEFLDILKSYSWPGNIRELENAIEYAINLEDGAHLTKDDLTPEIIDFTNHNSKVSSLKKQLHKYEVSILRDTMLQYKTEKNGINKAAKALDISRASLYQKIKEYNIEY